MQKKAKILNQKENDVLDRLARILVYTAYEDVSKEILNSSKTRKTRKTRKK